MSKYYVRYGLLGKVRVATVSESWQPKRGMLCLAQEGEHQWWGRLLYPCGDGVSILASETITIQAPSPEQEALYPSQAEKNQEICEEVSDLAESLNLDFEVFKVEESLGGDLHRVYYQCLDISSLRTINEAWEEKGKVSALEWIQVGARIKAKLCGGIAVCGREYCCTTVLRDLTPVTMRMARAEARSLQPDDTAGACGRLKCCLRYEFEDLDDILGPGARVRARRIDGQIVAVAEPGRSLWVENDRGLRLEVFLKEILEVDGQPIGQRT
ncbi:MAG: regulatory iron-sulfur-containing complex subunit RicT [Planctomycetota bacterium]|nr:regulatory iron-sulfur-containing complex subunit RicT [Planctomycetota bacterium]